MLQPDTALRQRLGMRVKFANFRAAIVPDEAMLNRHHDLRDDFQRALHEQVERVGDHALG